ncbi:MAG: hypothetical protein U1C55_06130 [Smithellaceae bacterium]|nr:hypothetical protein [Smithellaceae bacterium]
MLTEQRELVGKILAFVREDEANRLGGNTSIYDEPLVGFAQARDPLFEKLKEEEVIGDVHRSPEEWLPGALCVISYFLPFSREIRSSNYGNGLASEEWLQGRFQGEGLNNKLRKFLVEELTARGGRAIAPAIDKDWMVDYQLCRSNWSERHAAFIAGLGTFSLNRGMITSRGMAGRFGSVITNLEFTPTERAYRSPFEHCPFLVDGSCGACIDRCPVGAITAEGKDKKRCHQYIFIEDPLAEIRMKYGYPQSACGKCQTSVPCETGIP